MSYYYHYIAKWTPSGSSSGAWSTFGTGLNASVYALAVDGNNNIYMGGEFTHTCYTAKACDVPGEMLNHVAMWTPSGATASWHALGNGFFTSGLGSGVWGLALDDRNNLYATGDLYSLCPPGACRSLGIPINHADKWNGSTWSPLGSGFARSLYTWMRGVAWKSGIVSYAGDFYTAGGKVSADFAQYEDALPVYLPFIKC